MDGRTWHHGGSILGKAGGSGAESQVGRAGSGRLRGRQVLGVFCFERMFCASRSKSEIFSAAVASKFCQSRKYGKGCKGSGLLIWSFSNQDNTF